jgi:ABC-2 type transport system permease protein
MNYYGLKILIYKEIVRFLKVYNQTIIAPIITSLLYLCVFVLALNGHTTYVNNIPFEEFMASGLIIMSILQNAFSNSSSSLIMSKVIGYVIDILMPPFTGFEIVTAYVIGSMIRGLIVGISLFVVLSFFVQLHVYSLTSLILYTLMSTFLMGLVGIFAGIYSSSFDQNAAFNSCFVTPLSFLSGTFYSTKSLPIFFQKINLYNPFFYMIDGFRYSMTGVTDGNISFGLYYILFLSIVFYFVLIYLFNKGFRIKT